MLQSIRDRAHGLIAAVIIFFLIVTFALWGIQSYLNATSDVTVAEINGEELTLRAFQWGYQQYRRQLQTALGEQLEIRDLDQEAVKRQALQALIDEELLRQLASSEGLRISDEQIAAAIRSIEAFQEDGEFSNALYERRLDLMGMNPSSFERQLRSDMLAEQIRQGIAESSFVTESEMDKIERLEAQERDFRYAIIAAEPLKESIEISDEEVKSHYEKSRDRYMTPELVRVVYIDLSLENLAKLIAADDTLLRAYYEQNRDKYTAVEERSANHILVRVDRDAGAEEVEAARTKASEYRELALSGKSFEEIAREHSDDAGSRAEGGDTGFFRRGVMAPEFDKSVFSMQPGEISEPIRTDFGFHIIRLNEIRAGGLKPYEQVVAEVERDYRLEEAQEFYYEQADQLATLAYENPDTLEAAAEALNLPVQQSEFFGRSGGDGLFARKEIIEAAFSPEILYEGLNSAPLELDDNRIVVLRNIDHQVSELRPLEEVRQSIVEELTAERAKAIAYERGRALLERLRAGESSDSLAESEHLEWVTAEGVDRRSPEVGRAIVRTAFTLRRPEAGTAVYAGVAVGTGDYGIIELTAVHDDARDVESKSDDGDRRLREQLALLNGRRDWQEFMKSLEANADVTTHPGNL
jgi:peptidyl-prolyl cis-trans isomerase D